MADDLKRVGLVFKADGTADFKKTLAQVNTVVQENRNAFNLAKAAWDESTSAMDKLKDRQEYLTKQTETYSDKVSVLKQELTQLESAEKRDEQAIRKKQNQLTQAQISLTKYQKGLEDVTHQLETGAGAADDEMRSLDQTLGDLSAAAKENETAFAALKSGYDESTKASQKYGDQQKYLAGQVKNYESQVDALEGQLKLLENAEDRNERAISEKRSELNQAKTALNTYKNSLDDVEKKLKSGKAATEEYANKLDSFGNKAKNAGEKMSGISTAAAGIIGAAAATVPATEEYRKIMGSLEVSSEKAGYSADQTKESYQTLYGVLADDQTAATTTANLQALGLSQHDLTNMINGTIGAWATYGDSIPIDGLAEAINETVKTGVVTGTFADMLNWAGTSEDAFNEKLAACSSESERANLIMQEMANQGLTQAGLKWQENNKNLVEGNQATANFQEATAQLADTIAPIITQITNVVAGLIEKFNALPPDVQQVIAVVLLLVAAIGPLLSGIGSMSMGISALLPIFKSLWAVMSANPVGAIITVIGLLVTAFITAYEKCEWFRDGVNAIFEKIGDAVEWLGKKIRDFFSFDWVSDIPIIGDVVDFVSGRSRMSTAGTRQRSALSAPELPVKWFAKGGILNRPTIFGSNGKELLAGGEAGAEAVIPVDTLRKYIREETQANNSVLARMIQDALAKINITAENNIYIGEKKIESTIVKMVIKKITTMIDGKRAARGK